MKKPYKDNGLYLERHAQQLLDYQQTSDDEDNITTNRYKQKALKYKNNLEHSQEIIRVLQKENQESKKIISELLLDIEDMKHRERMIENELEEQKKLTKSALDQLESELSESLEDRLLQEQKEFQQKLTIQSNEAIEKLKQHFDEQLKLIATPQNNDNSIKKKKKKSSSTSNLKPTIPNRVNSSIGKKKK